MKKSTRLAGLIIASAICVTSVAALAACGGDGDEAKEYTVTYFDGSAELKKETVKEGGKAVKWTPEKDGYDFVDWYATPNFAHKFDFETPVTENKSAFAQWVSAEQVTDTREYYIVGSGTSPILMSSNWGKVFDETTKMTKAENKNEYTYTLDLQVGDLFQFAINESWHNQRGAGYLTTDKLEDGTLAFSGGGTIGDNSSYRLNIKCEYAGNYTFTLTTHPGDDTYETTHSSYTEENKEAFNINPLDKINWVRNGDVEAVEKVITNYYIKGAGITNWKDMYNDATKMKEKDGKYTLAVYLKEGEEFMFSTTNTVGTETSTGTEYLRSSNLDEAGKAIIDSKPSYNMVAKASGTYTFTYDEKTKVLSATFDATTVPAAADYYLDGTFAEGVADWNGYCFNEDFKLTEIEQDSGVYEIKNVSLKADSEFIVQAFKAGSTEKGKYGTESYNGLGSYNFTYLYGAGTLFEAVGGGNNNIKVKQAGNYDITFDSYAKMITIVEHIESADVFDIYIKGNNINSWKHNWSEDWLFGISADEKQYEFTLTVENDKPVEFGIEKFAKGVKEGYGEFLGVSALGEKGDANEKFVPESGSNLKCSVAGKYKIVYDIASKLVDIYEVTSA